MPTKWARHLARFLNECASHLTAIAGEGLTAVGEAAEGHKLFLPTKLATALEKFAGQLTVWFDLGTESGPDRVRATLVSLMTNAALGQEIQSNKVATALARLDDDLNDYCYYTVIVGLVPPITELEVGPFHVFPTTGGTMRFGDFIVDVPTVERGLGAPAAVWVSAHESQQAFDVGRKGLSQFLDCIYYCHLWATREIPPARLSLGQLNPANQALQEEWHHVYDVRSDLTSSWTIYPPEAEFRPLPDGSPDVFARSGVSHLWASDSSAFRGTEVHSRVVGAIHWLADAIESWQTNATADALIKAAVSLEVLLGDRDQRQSQDELSRLAAATTAPTTALRDRAGYILDLLRARNDAVHSGTVVNVRRDYLSVVDGHEKSHQAAEGMIITVGDIIQGVLTQVDVREAADYAEVRRLLRDRIELAD